MTTQEGGRSVGGGDGEGTSRRVFYCVRRTKRRPGTPPSLGREGRRRSTLVTFPDYEGTLLPRGEEVDVGTETRGVLWVGLRGSETEEDDVRGVVPSVEVVTTHFPVCHEGPEEVYYPTSEQKTSP